MVAIVMKTMPVGTMMTHMNILSSENLGKRIFILAISFKAFRIAIACTERSFHYKLIRYISSPPYRESHYMQVVRIALGTGRKRGKGPLLELAA